MLPGMAIHIETPRLLIRSFTGTDGEQWVNLVNDPDVNRFTPDDEPSTLESFRGVLEQRRASEREQGFAMWVVERRQGGEFLGQYGFYLSEGTRPEIEIAYHYLPAAWGRGYGTEAARAVLSYAFGSLGLAEVIALVIPANVGSWRVAEKVGMRLLSEDATYYGIPNLRKYALDGSTWRLAAG